MLKYRGALALAILAAIFSAGSLGAGLLAMGPALSAILDPAGPTLPQLVSNLDTKHARDLIPDAWIAALPTGRYDAVLTVIITLGVLTILGAIANFAHTYLSYTIASRAVADIRKDLYARVIRLPMLRVMGEGASSLVSRVIFDTQQLWSGFISLLSKALGQVFKGLAALGVALITEWRLALGAVVVGLVLGYIIKKLGTTVRRASRSSLAAYADTQKVASEALSQIRVVKTSTAEPREHSRFSRAVDAFLNFDLRVRTARALSSPIVEAVGIIVLGAMAIIPAKAIIDNKLDPADFLLTLGSLAVAAACLKPLTALYNELQVAGAAAGRLRQLAAEPLEPGSDARTAAPLASLPRHAASITIDDISVTYPGAERPALDRISLTIPHGQTVAFVGPNGCGKTTLLSLIPRLIEPASGSIRIDDIDIRTVTLESLRAQIGVVTQEAPLFSGTIRENIAYAVESATDAQVRAAARKARAEDFILARPDGYDTVLGEQGAGLSGGQRQRLCIARAILKDPGIVILDEATSMVDSDSEAKIADALAEFTRGTAASSPATDATPATPPRTCLIVAHRLSTVIHADLIVVMNQGRIEATGRHHDLLERSETYRLIASTQLVPAAAGKDA